MKMIKVLIFNLKLLHCGCFNWCRKSVKEDGKDEQVERTPERKTPSPTQMKIEFQSDQFSCNASNNGDLNVMRNSTVKKGCESRETTMDVRKTPRMECIEINRFKNHDFPFIDDDGSDECPRSSTSISTSTAVEEGSANEWEKSDSETSYVITSSEISEILNYLESKNKGGIGDDLKTKENLADWKKRGNNSNENNPLNNIRSESLNPRRPYLETSL